MEYLFVVKLCTTPSMPPKPFWRKKNVQICGVYTVTIQTTFVVEYVWYPIPKIQTTPFKDKCRVILIIVRETKNKKLSDRERERETVVFLKTPKPLFFSLTTLFFEFLHSFSLSNTKPKKERKWKTKKENQSIRSNTQFTHFTLSDQNFYFYFFNLFLFN